MAVRKAKLAVVCWLAVVCRLAVVRGLTGTHGDRYRLWQRLRTKDYRSNSWYESCGVSKFDDAAGENHIFPHIVGGQEAREGELPWQAAMYIGNYHHCGGVLIDESWVLTAAHCVEDDTIYKVVLGDHDITQTDYSEQEFTIVSSDICINSNYSLLPWAYDIAMIRLPEPAIINEDVRPACRPDIFDDVTGELCTVSGWGETEPRQKTLPGAAGKSPILQYVNVPVVNWTDCATTYNDIRDIYTTNLCAGYPEGEKDACYGDSGGPLVCSRDGNFTLYGLVSWGEGCAQPNRPGIYTRVQSFVDWIDDLRQRLNDTIIC